MLTGDVECCPAHCCWRKWHWNSEILHPFLANLGGGPLFFFKSLHTPTIGTYEEISSGGRLQRAKLQTLKNWLWITDITGITYQCAHWLRSWGCASECQHSQKPLLGRPGGEVSRVRHGSCDCQLNDNGGHTANRRENEPFDLEKFVSPFRKRYSNFLQSWSLGEKITKK